MKSVKDDLFITMLRILILEPQISFDIEKYIFNKGETMAMSIESLKDIIYDFLFEERLN